MRDTTSTMLRRLQRTTDIKRFMEQNKSRMPERSFTEYLADKCRELNTLPDRVIRNTDIERSYGHQLFNGTRAPSRDKAIELAFGFGFGLDETQRLLRAAGKSELYPKLRRDAAIIFALERSMSITETQELLDELGLTILGGKKHDDR